MKGAFSGLSQAPLKLSDFSSRLSPRGERFLFREKYPGLLSRLERNKMNGTVLSVRRVVERKISMVLCVCVLVVFAASILAYLL